MPLARMSRNRFVSSGPRSRLYAVCVRITFDFAPRLARLWTNARQYRPASASTSYSTGTESVDRVPSGMSYMTRSRTPRSALSGSTPSREWRLSVHVVRGFHEALKEVLLEAVVDGLGVDGIRGFQSWFFGGRRRRLRRAFGGHGKNPLPLFPDVIISYLSATKATNCYGLLVSVETVK